MAYDSAREKKDARDQRARRHRAGPLLPAVRRRHRAALRGRLAEQAVSQDRAPPVRGAVRRLRHGLHGHRAHALQPQPVGRAHRLRRRARVRSRASRRRTDTGLVQDELRGDGTVGPVPPVARAHRDRQRQAAHRGARPLRDHARGRDAASCRASSTTTSTTSAARCSSRSRCRAAIRTSTRCSSWWTTKCATAARTRPRPACASPTKLDGDKLELGASAVYEGAQAGDTRIVGTDLTWRVPPQTTRARRSGAVAVGRSAASGFLDRLAGRGQARFRAPRSARLGARNRNRLRRGPAAHRRHGHAHAPASTRAIASTTAWASKAKCSTSKCSPAMPRACWPAPKCRMQQDMATASASALRHVADEDAERR